MKKRTEKHPVDDLFAGKLENMSLPPSPDGFARLQARMGQGAQETRQVFWRNPAIQGYMAVAACLLLVCLFGWLYLSTEVPISGKTTVAVNKPGASTGKAIPHDQKSPDPAVDVAATQPIPQRGIPDSIDSETTDSRLAERGKPAVDNQPYNDRIANSSRTIPKADSDASSVVPMKPAEQVAKTEMTTPSEEPTAAATMNEKQVAATTGKPILIAERVLVVTIAEPEALVAAHQAVKASTSEDAVAATTDKLEKETKAVSLWQQVKRIKQGEIFARKDAGEDERSLLGRAYNGLKQTFDKDKSIKQ